MKKLIILLFSCMFSLASFAQLEGFDFEIWEYNAILCRDLPVGWHGGVNSLQSSDAHSGNSSCEMKACYHDDVFYATMVGRWENLAGKPKYLSFYYKAYCNDWNEFTTAYSLVRLGVESHLTYIGANEAANVRINLHYHSGDWERCTIAFENEMPDTAIPMSFSITIRFWDYTSDTSAYVRIDDLELTDYYPGEGTIIKPVSDDIFIPGKKDTIKWKDCPPDKDLKIEYSLDNGNTYTEIAEVSPGDTSMYIWDVPDTLSAKCKVKLTYSDSGELFAESSKFIIKPYLLTRLESNGEMTQYNILTDRWGFANYPEDMWPEWYYNQFDYKGIDPFTNKLYDDVQAPIFGEINPYTFVSWEAFVKAFTTDACYFDVSTGIYSPMAIANWSTDTVAWGGSCFAIAGSNALAFSKKNAFLSTYSTFPAFGTPLSVTSSEAVIDNITRIYAHCYGDPTHQNWVNPPAYNQITPLQVVNELKTHFSKADVTPRAISFWHNHGSGGHSVLPYQLRQDASHENIYYIDIYDNAYPNDVEAKIQVNLEDNGGNGSWFYDNFPDWGGSTKLKLECDANAYLSQPILKKGERSDFILAGDSIRIGGNRFEDIRITDNQGKSAGYYDDQLKYDIEGSLPLIPPTGSLRKPYAYYLPGGNYSLTLDNFTSEVANAFFFYNNKALIYKRNDAGESQTDRLIFGNGLSIANPDEESKKAQIDLIIKEMDREKVFRLHPMPLEPDDSIRFESPDDNQMILYNYGSAKQYGAELNSFSSGGFERFVNDQITIEKNTSHRFIINWTEVEESALTVYVDNEMNGSYEDTLLLNYHVTGIDDKEINSLIADLNLQVWPNPAEDKITFSYRLNSGSEISIKIFDSLGREIKTPLNPERQIQGKHNLTVNIAELPAGIYYYHFIVNNYKINGKIIKL